MHPSFPLTGLSLYSLHSIQPQRNFLVVGCVKQSVTMVRKDDCHSYFVRFVVLQRLPTVGPVCIYCLPHHPNLLVHRKSRLLEKSIDPVAVALERQIVRVP